MGDFLLGVFTWVFNGALIAGLIGSVVWVIGVFTSHDRIKIYYDDNDHSKGYYYIGKPGGTYPIGYPRERIVKDMEDYERLKQEQKNKRRKKTRPMWVKILLMTPSEYMEYRRQRK